MRPVVFLDFDGVLNALRYRDDKVNWQDWQREIVNDGLHDYRITYSPTMCKRLLELQDRADFVWCTTWRDLANTELAPIIGFPGDWPVVDGWHEMYDQIQWKWIGVKDFLFQYNDRPFVWVDDDECRQEFVERWAAKLPQPHLTIAPNTTTGLTEFEVSRIERFVDKNFAP